MKAFLAAMALAIVSGCSAAPPAYDEPVDVPAEPVTSEPNGPAAFEIASSSCDNEWPVVVLPGPPAAFVADAMVSNTGGADGTAAVTATWFPVGSEVTDTQEVEVPAGGEVRVAFRKEVPASVAAGMVGRQHGDRMCAVSTE